MTTGPRLRRALDRLPAYRPGRRPVPRTDVPVYKISSNENPYAPLPGVLEAALEAAGVMNRYPDMFATELSEAIATRLSVPAEHVVCGTGSVGVLKQIVHAVADPGDEIVYPWRSFEAYPIVAGVAGATSVRIPVTTDGRHDLDAMAAAVTDRTRLVLLCTPNNPTGPALHRDEVEQFLDKVPDDVLVVIDEAYREFVRDESAVDGIDVYRDRGNVCVLRTFSKAYGLAGLRVGFAVAHSEVAEALHKTAVPFGVNAIAQHAAIESLRSEPALLERVESLVKERARVWEALRAQGWDVPVTEANFVWLGLGADADDFAAACEESGVTVRPFAGEGVRVTVAEPEANDVFLRVAGEWRARR